MFDIADVHASPHTMNPNLRGGVIRGGRFEVRTATMLDLITVAYRVEAGNVLSGPSWLESDRFDIIAKAPRETSQESAKLMLQSLLADRFQLVLHQDTKPLQAFVLSAGKGKHKLKETDGSASGCQPQPPSGPPEPGTFPQTLIICHNMTMDAFASQLHQMAGGYLTGPVVNSTGIPGAWDFNIHWTGRKALAAAGSDGVSIFDAVDRQLGLKLELQKVPAPVIIVDSVNQKPTANPPGVTTALPPAPPAEFEVADIKPSAPDERTGGGGFQPGGRIDLRALPLYAMISLAWNIPPLEELVGVPKWLERDSPKFDLIAKVSGAVAAPANGPPVDIEDLRNMLRALLIERFKITTHYEDRPVSTYTLVAAKPKLKKADPLNRAKCKTGPASGNSNGGNGPPQFQATCTNMTMAQFANELPNIAPIYLHYAVPDATGIEGAWDFSLTFSPVPPNLAAGGRGGGGKEGGPPAAPPPAGSGASPNAVAVASDPSGALSLFDALERQLGLKLEMHRNLMPVLVIDHIEPKPTEN